MSNDDPREQKRRRLERSLDSLRDDIADLQGEITFSDLVSDLSQATAALPDLTADLQRLRSRGYAFRGDLEAAVDKAREEAEPVMEALRREINQVDDRLQREVKSLTRDASKIRGKILKNEQKISTLESKLRGVKSEISGVEDRLKAHSGPLLKSIGQTTAKVKDLHWTLDQFDSATFKMAPEERPVAVAAATWDNAPGGAQPAGMLMFTDHRVRFEQNEERVTKRKFLVFTAEKEHLHTLLLDEPVGHLEESQDATRGWVMKDQLLTVTGAKSAKAPTSTTFEISSGSASDWDGIVELIRSGDLSSHESEAAAVSRAPDIAGGAPAAAAAHRVKWPEQCAGCDAPLTAPVKGQTALVCEYCGTNHAVEYLQG